MENREAVLIEATEESPGVVAIIWTDRDETPLQAIGRLSTALESAHAEVVEAKERVAVDFESLRSEIQDVEGELSNALDQIQSAGSYAGDAESAIESAGSYLASLSDEVDSYVSNV
jgi:hypothetical protein